MVYHSWASLVVSISSVRELRVQSNVAFSTFTIESRTLPSLVSPKSTNLQFCCACIKDLSTMSNMKGKYCAEFVDNES